MEKFHEYKDILHPEDIEYSQKKKTLLLNINKGEISLDGCDNVVVNENLKPKTEFHVTILGFSIGSKLNKLIKKMKDEDREIFESNLNELFNNTDWSFSFKDDKYFLTKEYKTQNSAGEEEIETRKSIIQLIEMPNLEHFFNKFSELTGLEVDLPFPHITLYSNSDKEGNEAIGIGIKSRDFFDSLNPQKIS